MGSKMLIDAAHPEETRVVVVRGSRVEDFDYESATRKQLRGNIYLAKVTRVEPSLQAAFVDYGGNRHGFLAFNEIHPDYYQIPVADRQQLLDEEAEEESRAEAAEALQDEVDDPSPSDDGDASGDDVESDDGTALEAADLSEIVTDPPDVASTDDDDDGADEEVPETELADAPEPRGLVEDLGLHNVGESSGTRENGGGSSVESVGSEDALEEVPQRTRRMRRVYKIQEVIKRRQIILVQVVKEERGNKGAALTTYLSLAGRYTVLMPNTARGGGISRKINISTDRRRLRKIVADLEVPDGRGLIVRTAGASRTKAEIKRDFEYLLRLWENIRDLTLDSTAPALVYEEGNLIKRSIRDLYGKEIDEVLVSGDQAYKEAKGFMRMLMPSHAKNVQPYKEPEPVFVRHKIERQLAAMFSPYVTLRSGGYVVINQTEALVAVDVNSGKATREHNIEDTALKTNLEAAEEVSRQLRLRDLAGLIVIDFIDMEERRNNRAVERKLKDCLRNDRARIQLGRISHFGLMEMSRQRLRAGVLEGSTSQCTMCQGTGLVRSTESVALDVLRSLEDALLTRGKSNMTATTSVEVALYILNHKRQSLRDIETRYGIAIAVLGDEEMRGAQFQIEQSAASVGEATGDLVVQMDWALEDDQEETSEDEEEKRKPRRRRRRKRGRGEQADEEAGPESMEVLADGEAETETGETAETETGETAETETGEGNGTTRKRRRGRRGGRRGRQAGRAAASEVSPNASEPGTEDAGVRSDAAAPEPDAPPSDPETGPASEDGPGDGERPLADAPGETVVQPFGGVEPAREPESLASDDDAPEAPLDRPDGARAAGVDEHPAPAIPEPVDARPAETVGEEPLQVGQDKPAETPEDEAAQSRRRGWWQRRIYQSG